MSAEEQRIDPEDGMAQTLAQLRRKYAGRYDRDVIDDYWMHHCVPLEGSPGGGNDPFLTHGSQQPRAPAPGREASESAREDPFLAHQQGPAPQANLREDPFMTHGQFVPQARRQQFVQAADKVRQGWLQVLQSLLGPGAADRKLPARNALILGPFLAFMWVVLVWVLLQHYSAESCVLLTAILCGGCAFMMFAWYTGKRWGPVSLLPLGLLCLLAVLMGTSVGKAGWGSHWRGYWWLQTGLRTMGTSASTSAAARVDSAVIQFNSNGHTTARTLVDDMRSAGYQEGHRYCVAPVLDPTSAGANEAVVSYWAVGLDCCGELGSFTCDASRSHNGGYGVVMLDGGYPCPGCNAEKFRAAVTKAEAMHGLVSAPGAIYVRWVSDVSAVEFEILLGALTFVLLSAFFGFVSFFILGSTFWYFGIGARTRESDPLWEASAIRSKIPTV
jgi:hypothetical protein